MKVLFICDLPKEHFPFWNDGLKAALDVLRNKYQWEIDILNTSKPEDINTEGYDVGLFWGALAKDIHKFKYFDKQVLCFAGGPTFTPNIHNFDLIFAESRVDLLDFKRFGKNTIQAFGTNTSLFKPMLQPKIFSYIYPAAFARWKHHEKFAEFISKELGVLSEQTEDLEGYDLMIPALAVGYMQPDEWEKECYEVCQQNGIMVMPWVPYEAMPYLINSSEKLYVGASEVGGCQRAILEAVACGVPVVVDSDSNKLQELSKLTREDVLKDWSEFSYAKKLKEGLESLF